MRRLFFLHPIGIVFLLTLCPISAQAGWLSGWFSGGGSAPSEQSQTLTPVVSEIPSVPSSYGGPRPVIVLAPGTRQPIRTQADIAAQNRRVADRAQHELKLTEKIMENKLRAKQANGRARALASVQSTGSVQNKPVPPVVAPLLPFSGQKPSVPILQDAESAQKPIQPILPALGGRGAAPTGATAPSTSLPATTVIQPILPVLKAPAQPPKKE